MSAFHEALARIGQSDHSARRIDVKADHFAAHRFKFHPNGVRLGERFGEGSKIVVSILAAIVDADVETGLDGITLIAVVAVFVLSEVFREGARMKEEQDLTV